MSIGTERSPSFNITLAETDAAKQWQGWGTALKPANEPICVARKPLEVGLTVAQNVQKWGTGGLNIDAARINASAIDREAARVPMGQWAHSGTTGATTMRKGETYEMPPTGRWPANVIHDGSEEVIAGFPESAGQSGDVKGTEPSSVTNGIYGEFAGRLASPARNDTGSASRFFYCAKASKAERGEYNNHPTVKPVAVMRWMVRLVTPPGETCMDPFVGSGTTMIACAAEGIDGIGIDEDEVSIITARRRTANYRDYDEQEVIERITKPNEIVQLGLGL